MPTTAKPTTRRPTTTTTRRTTTPWNIETTTVPYPGIAMPEPHPTPQPEECEPGQYLPDTTNCNAYYRCVLGEKKKNFCASGLHWNKERNICDWPDNAKCETRSNIPSTTKRPTTRYTKPTTTNYITRSTTRRAITTTRRPPTTSAIETCENGQYYPHEQCNSFYVCVNGQLVSQKCAPGLQWSVSEGMCDWVYKVKCLGRRKFGESFQKIVRGRSVR